ncbi:MAG: hypothetical protein HDT42_06170 [Ruminococcaceae bacterium]|nr:hypothetical protein [Oscillospiraceae bacterium]
MIDLYLDDIVLSKIQEKHNEQILIFRNNEKDETIALNVSNAELLNIFLKVKMRCEALNLTPITDFKMDGKDGENEC